MLKVAGGISGKRFGGPKLMYKVWMLAALKTVPPEFMGPEMDLKTEADASSRWALATTLKSFQTGLLNFSRRSCGLLLAAGKWSATICETTAESLLAGGPLLLKPPVL